jgi:lysozyme
MSNLISGVDISTLQGNVDFPALAAAGIRFVIIRCGVGNDGIDANFHTNVANATAAGLKVMAYHFIFPLPSDGVHANRDPVSQAQLHFNAAGPNILAACDFEWPVPQDWSEWGCTAAQINQWCLTYLQTYQQLSGQTMVLYTYPYFAQSLNLPAEFANYPLWIASYEPTPTIPAPWTTWVLWQDSSGPYHLPVSGIPVDTDKAKDLSLWEAPLPTPPVVVQPTPAPTPVPVPAPVSVPVPPPVVPVPTPSTTSNIWLTIANLFSTMLSWFRNDVML